MMNAPILISAHKMFNGRHERYTHRSQATGTGMAFSVYLPPQALQGYRVPVLYWLSGLTCTDENFSVKSGAQRFASHWGIALVIPDTSPRGGDVPAGNGEIGLGAGFYLNAVQEPWAQHYQMYDYVAHELPQLIEAHFPVNDQRSIAGHSMGGHGALQTALKNPGRYAAVSAFAPMANPSATPLGRQAFAAYLGEDQALWAQYDSTELVKHARHKLPILIDQGDADPFYPQQLQPEPFVSAARANGFNVQFNLRKGYDHGYYFIASFIDVHIEFHADAFGL